jgi:tetratricopeptide (TPR) repeat protein
MFGAVAAYAALEFPAAKGVAMSKLSMRMIAFVLSTLWAPPLFADGGGSAGGAEAAFLQTQAYKDAVTAIKAGRYAQAIKLLEPYVLSNDGDADGHNWLAFAHRKTGNLDLAFRHYKRALAIDPQHRGAHEYIGEAYLMASQPEKAEAHAKTLAGLCREPCEELTDLRVAIAAYRASPRSSAARTP